MCALTNFKKNSGKDFLVLYDAPMADDHVS